MVFFTSKHQNCKIITKFIMVFFMGWICRRKYRRLLNFYQFTREICNNKKNPPWRVARIPKTLLHLPYHFIFVSRWNVHGTRVLVVGNTEHVGVVPAKYLILILFLYNLYILYVIIKLFHVGNTIINWIVF